MPGHIEPSSWRPVDITEMEPSALDVIKSVSHTYVIAGPGAGKTELLAQRACYLLQTGIVLPPRRILAISFKRDAARNLKSRVDDRCRPEDSARFDSFTFDAFAKGLLDRFWLALPALWRPTIDYEILLTNSRTYINFLNSLTYSSASPFAPEQVEGLSRNTFEKLWITGSPLRADRMTADSPGLWAASMWWNAALRATRQSKLTFPMIGRLAELLVRENPKLRRLICMTYANIFLDEFQDTTHVQYDLIKTLFQDSTSDLTAVGDNKQQIMRWAMALSDPFDHFRSDFSATRLDLLRNHRSSPELVRIQHQIALAVDTQSAPVVSTVAGTTSTYPCAVYEFDSVQKEADHLARMIGAPLARGELGPRDFAILVRQKSADYTRQLQHRLAQSGISIRDESQIQDVLAERLVLLLIRFLRLGSLQRGGEHWIACSRIVRQLKGPDGRNSSSDRRLQETLRGFHELLQTRMSRLPDNPDSLGELFRTILGFLGEEQVKILYPEYSQGDWYEEVLESTVDLMLKSCQSSTGWPECIDDFEGVKSVPVVTIHKSKGLEYHTVIFLALDDSAWWSFRQDPQESKSTFFVAFSRAKQQVAFTYCRERGTRSGVSSLYEILRSAGVPTVSSR